jgi:hypothetical protein
MVHRGKGRVKRIKGINAKLGLPRDRIKGIRGLVLTLRIKGE